MKPKPPLSQEWCVYDEASPEYWIGPFAKHQLRLAKEVATSLNATGYTDRFTTATCIYVRNLCYLRENVRHPDPGELVDRSR